MQLHFTFHYPTGLQEFIRFFGRKMSLNLQKEIKIPNSYSFPFVHLKIQSEFLLIHCCTK